MKTDGLSIWSRGFAVEGEVQKRTHASFLREPVFQRVVLGL